MTDSRNGSGLDELRKKRNKELINDCLLKIQAELSEVDDVINGNLFSLLHFAANCGDIETLRWLAQHGANVNLKITDGHLEGYHALHLAVLKGHMEVSQFLIEEAKVPVDVTTLDGDTAFYMAILKCNEPIINLLYTHGANVNASIRPNGIHYTLLEKILSEVVTEDNLKSAELLLKCAPTITSGAIDAVIRNCNVKGVKLLIQYGANFTRDSLELATSEKNQAFEKLENMKKDLNLNQDKMSVERRYFLATDISNIYTRNYLECEEVVTLINGAIEIALKHPSLKNH